MSLPEKLHCWEIIKCEESENCMASRFPDVPCWEIDHIYGTGQGVLDVCRECKVYLLKENDLLLTGNEIQDIIQHREVMKFVKKCPAYNNRLRNDDGMAV